MDSYKRPRVTPQGNGDENAYQFKFKGLNERRRRQFRRGPPRDFQVPPPEKRIKSSFIEDETAAVVEDVDENTIASVVDADTRSSGRRRTSSLAEFDEKERSKNKKMFSFICGTLKTFQKEEEERRKTEPPKMEAENDDTKDAEHESGDEEEGKEKEGGGDSSSSVYKAKETEEERMKRLEEAKEAERKAIEARWKLNQRLADRFTSTKTTPKIYWATNELVAKLSKKGEAKE